jgi:hypothetical protein
MSLYTALAWLSVHDWNGICIPDQDVMRTLCRCDAYPSLNAAAESVSSTEIATEPVSCSATPCTAKKVTSGRMNWLATPSGEAVHAAGEAGYQSLPS